MDSGDGAEAHNSSTSHGNRLSMQGDRHFSYDERGNLICEKRGKGGKLVTTFDYNLNNQLIAVTKDGQRTDYRYDPLGRRIEKRDTFGSTRYLWAGDQLVQEQRGEMKKTYIYEPESFKPVALIQDGELYHYHLDHLGTPKELSNEQGKVVWKARYKAYGNLALKEVEELENNLRFQGQYFDEETGLHYNRHRYYNPNTGQFTTQDPIGLWGGVNNYQYAANPIGWVDPLGLTCKEIPENYDPLTDTYTGVDLNLFSPEEQIYFSAKNVKNNAHIFVVGGHGNPISMVDALHNEVAPESLAKMIRNHPKHTQGMPVYLLSCNTGKGDNGFAQQLSDIMKAPVKAPDEYLWYWPDGKVAPYGMTKNEDGGSVPDVSKPGKINEFKPQKNR